MTYNPQFEIKDKYNLPKDSRTTSIFSLNFKNGKYIHRERDTSKRYPYNIISFNTEKNRLHPTQKPVALIEYLIKTYTNENELVLDNTAGSMTTAIAAINTNRRCICIEKDDKYFEIGSERVKKHLQDLDNE